MTNNLPCAGVIVFNRELDHCVVVSTNRGNHGFPKGKRNKGENYIDNAIRELQEETGLEPKDLIFVDKTKYIDELSKKGNPCTRYLVAKIDKDMHKIVFKFDPTELAEVKWYKIDDIMKLLIDKRKCVLNEALKLIK